MNLTLFLCSCEGGSDTFSIQCNVSNIHGSSIGSGYLSVYSEWRDVGVDQGLVPGEGGAGRPSASTDLQGSALWGCGSGSRGVGWVQGCVGGCRGVRTNRRVWPPFHLVSEGRVQRRGLTCLSAVPRAKMDPDGEVAILLKGGGLGLDGLGCALLQYGACHTCVPQ